MEGPVIDRVTEETQHRIGPRSTGWLSRPVGPPNKFQEAVKQILRCMPPGAAPAAMSSATRQNSSAQPPACWMSSNSGHVRLSLMASTARCLETLSPEEHAAVLINPGTRHLSSDVRGNVVGLLIRRDTDGGDVEPVRGLYARQ